MNKYIKIEDAIEVFLKRTKPLYENGNIEGYYRYLQWFADCNAIKNIPPANVVERKEYELLKENYKRLKLFCEREWGNHIKIEEVEK